MEICKFVYFVNNWVLLKVCVNFAEINFAEVKNFAGSVSGSKILLYPSMHMYSRFLKLCFACTVESMVPKACHVYCFVTYFHHLPKKGKITGEVFFIVLCHI